MYYLPCTRGRRVGMHQIAMLESLTRQLSSSIDGLRQVLDKPQQPLNLIPAGLVLI